MSAGPNQARARHARILRPGSYFDAGDLLEVIIYTGICGTGQDGADADGDYWAAQGVHKDPTCIGRPGVDFEFVAIEPAAPERVDVIAAWDRQIVQLRDLVATNPGCEGHELELLAAERARAAVAELVAERDALRWALSEYPKRNPHQLQARKVCDGVAALALARIGDGVA